MLTKKQMAEARQFNIRNIGVLYNLPDLPWPWCEVDQDTFVLATALFQIENNIIVDGKLGNETLRRLNKLIDMSIINDENKNCFSNSIIVDGNKIKLPDNFIRLGITASNFIDDSEVKFASKDRKHKVINFVLHETCGNSSAGCKNTLVKKGYGVQLILDPFGHLSCHGDLIKDRMIHANQLNDVSFGMEIVNPYNPIYVISDELWKEKIEKQWWTWIPSIKDKNGKINKVIERLLRKNGFESVPKKYVTPTMEQMSVIKYIVPWLCEITGVPYRFPTLSLNEKKRKIDGINLKPRGRPGPGIVAHQDIATHSDGRYILEKLIDMNKNKMS